MNKMLYDLYEHFYQTVISGAENNNRPKLTGCWRSVSSTSSSLVNFLHHLSFSLNTSAGKEELLIQLMAVWMDCDLSSALPVLGLVPAQPGRLTTNEAWSLRGAAAADTRVPLKPSVIASLWTLYDLPLCSGRLVGCVHSGISIFTLKRQDLLFFLS